MREGCHGVGIANPGQHTSPRDSLERVMCSSQGLPWQLGLREHGPNHRVLRELLWWSPERHRGTQKVFQSPPPTYTLRNQKKENGDALSAGKVSLDTELCFRESEVQPFPQEPREPGPQLLQDELVVPSDTLQGTVLGSHSQVQGGHGFGGVPSIGVIKPWVRF